MKLHEAFKINGQPILGTYVAADLEEIKLCRKLGLNSYIGSAEDLDPATDKGKYCLENGMKVMYHMLSNIYGKPRFAARIDTAQTTLPLNHIAPWKAPESGVVQADDELIRYERRTDDALLDCTRGYAGTTPAEHRENMILFFPELCREEVEQVKDSPNLGGYYVLDDSPGDAISALTALYKLIRSIDGDIKHHPVVAGYGSAGALHNFGPDVCDLMMLYWYPIYSDGTYDRLLTSQQVQWMMAEARRLVPGMPFVGVYQSFNANFGGEKEAVPTAEQLREQLEDFVREGASGFVAFLCAKKHTGFASYPHMQDVLAEAHKEILETGGLTVAEEPELLKNDRSQPIGHWDTPVDVPGYVPAWHVVSPFDDTEGKILDAVFPPEETIDFDAVYDGKTGPIRWIKRKTIGGVLGLGELLGPHSFTRGCIAYATCTVTSPKAQKVQMRVCSDDDGIVWINGQDVWRFEGMRGVTRDAEMVEVELPEGESTILFKDYNRNGMWGVFLRFCDLDGKPLEGLTFSPTKD